jgi:hypothetical protein
MRYCLTTLKRAQIKITIDTTMTKFIKITISKTGKALYYRGDGFWFGRCSEAFARQKIAEGVEVWRTNINPALAAGVIAG